MQGEGEGAEHRVAEGEAGGGVALEGTAEGGVEVCGGPGVRAVERGVRRGAGGDGPVVVDCFVPVLWQAGQSLHQFSSFPSEDAFAPLTFIPPVTFSPTL